MMPDQIAALLGRPSPDPLVERTLDEFKIRRKPQVERDEGNADGPVIETQDWVVNRRLGIEFGFEDEASFLGRAPAKYGTGPMLLTQVYLYGHHDQAEPYRGSLPFGLTINDDRRTVRAKLARWDGGRRSYVRDTWELPDFRVTISYADNGRQLGFLVCLLRRPPITPSEDRVSPIPAIDQILGAFGKQLQSPAVRDLFAPFGVAQRLESRTEGAVADFRNEFGFELRFDRDAGLAGGLVMAEASFYRDHEMDACGWPGLLPFNLKFDDSPEMLLQKAGSPPNEKNDEMFVGFALWHCPNYSVQVRYSTMENWILCVRAMAPGVWERYARTL